MSYSLSLRGWLSVRLIVYILLSVFVSCIATTSGFYVARYACSLSVLSLMLLMLIENMSIDVLGILFSDKVFESVFCGYTACILVFEFLKMMCLLFYIWTLRSTT